MPNSKLERVLTIWFRFCCDIAPLGGGGAGPGVGAPTGVEAICCWWEGIDTPAPGPILPLRGAGLGAPPGADMFTRPDALSAYLVY